MPGGVAFTTYAVPSNPHRSWFDFPERYANLDFAQAQIAGELSQLVKLTKLRDE
jgi:hypothetical protein